MQAGRWRASSVGEERIEFDAVAAGQHHGADLAVVMRQFVHLTLHQCDATLGQLVALGIGDVIAIGEQGQPVAPVADQIGAVQ